MVITSPRCVQGIIKCLINSKLDGSWSNKPIFVVGEATARLVVKELNLKPIGADSGNAMALIPTILNCKVLLKQTNNNCIFKLLIKCIMFFIFR